MTRLGIRNFLKRAPDIQVVGEARNGDETKRLVAHLRPQILLLDLVMPKLSPAELEKWVRTNYPETVVLVLTAHDRDYYLSSMLIAGAAGYLDKKLKRAQLVSAIRRATRGELLFDKKQLERARRWIENVSTKWEKLSAREREVLQMLTEGMRNKGIAASLKISTNTVEKHLEGIYKKLEVTSRAEAIHWCVENIRNFRN
jgi:DNA-binding NarL/FixJ family response regulator